MKNCGLTWAPTQGLSLMQLELGIGTWNWNSGEYDQGTSADILPTNWTDDQIDTMC